MLNYEVDPNVLQPLVPPGPVLDSFQGKYFASIVGFQFRSARLFGIPVPFHQCFEEVNLRFYVRREMADGPRRGVVFVKEIVPKPAITWMARRLYNENYVACNQQRTRLRCSGFLWPGICLIPTGFSNFRLPCRWLHRSNSTGKSHRFKVASTLRRDEWQTKQWICFSAVPKYAVTRICYTAISLGFTMETN